MKKFFDLSRWGALTVLLTSGFFPYIAFSFEGPLALIFLLLLPALWTQIWIPLFQEGKEEKRYLRFYEFSVLIFGPFALFGVAITFFLPGQKHIAEDFREYLSADMVFSPTERLKYGITQNYWIGEKHKTISPFVDIMRGDNAQMKRSTIDKVIQHPNKYSRNILNLGLLGEDQDIRFYAASGMILLNDTFMNSFKELYKEIEMEPENPENYLKLAKAYDRYCYLELPEKEDIPKYYQKIEGAYRKVLAINPDDEDALIGLGRVLLKERKTAEAEQILKQGITLYGQYSAFFPWYLEVLSIRKRFSEIQQLAFAYDLNKNKISKQYRSVLLYWKNAKKEITAS